MWILELIMGFKLHNRNRLLVFLSLQRDWMTHFIVITYTMKLYTIKKKWKILSPCLKWPQHATVCSVLFYPPLNVYILAEPSYTWMMIFSSDIRCDYIRLRDVKWLWTKVPNIFNARSCVQTKRARRKIHPDGFGLSIAWQMTFHRTFGIYILSLRLCRRTIVNAHIWLASRLFCCRCRISRTLHRKGISHAIRH